ncbi:cytidylate kinase [Candidatus Daviesbacteria bacterium RIFCSPHIGHO2_02_FULL_36_13]|uniref:Cytidylate kinase n=1 Tax=Candidatus Daviesbacteria bacterium RIFCSPHIGHO2_02_FULL_36_13 TaxID=1797768 RepID=A0A1F5JS35_9BACT|nr:MAG: cytidylate kinase [Candidatus Daviesbacteria bacterium RIFCSPHIGHO2_02_FULL_36_13]OGE43056.1 MAG: cytidylate kinase [Candidatus Daviesbacteria bacterium RIFCSPLOWO2_01_FULL_36_8]
MEIVTIDGPTSSGKNSVGFLLSQKLGYQYIDTGMIYRVGTYLVLTSNTALNDVAAIVNIFKSLNLRFQTDESELRIFNEDVDLTGFLHNQDVTQNVPIVAAIKEVREITKVVQRRLGESQNTVMTGRDIGSEIFPEAKYKFFLTAKVEIRAKRRFDQLIKINPTTSYETVLDDMIKRDKVDTEREVSPLRIPEGAIVIDNSNLNVEQSVEEALKHINA